MAANDQLSDGKGLTDFSVDPNVKVPDHVKKAALDAEALHKQVYKEDLPQPAQPEHTHANVPDAAGEEAARAEAARAAAAAADPHPQNQPDPAKPGVSSDDEGVSAVEWRHRFLSMKGRFDAATRQMGADRQQMQELADELTRTQSLLQPRSSAAQPQAPRGQDHKKLITEQDRETYGDDLIDVARRVAMETVGPEIESLRAENQNLKKQVTSTGQRELRDALTHAVPDWSAINKSPQFLNWLALRNIYTGQVRREMLNAAYAAADAPRVIALFRDFVTEVRATGQTVQTSQGEQQEEKPAPRTAAMDLSTLAAPGKAKPASGDTAMPADKPVITRAQIKKYFDDKRRGFYAGREAQAAQFEAELTTAQAEGRVR